MTETTQGLLPQTFAYTNVIEALVEEEVDRQIQFLPIRIRRYLRPIEVVTYALNRLEPLYACSQTGVKAQRQKAQSLYGDRIRQVVTWGIRAVQNDLLRRFEPITIAPLTNPSEETALQSIRALLQDPDMTWDTLRDLIDRTLKNCRTPDSHKPHQQEHTPSKIEKPEALSWTDYKNRRAEYSQKNIHLNRATPGAAGSLKLFS